MKKIAQFFLCQKQGFLLIYFFCLKNPTLFCCFWWLQGSRGRSHGNHPRGMEGGCTNNGIGNGYFPRGFYYLLPSILQNSGFLKWKNTVYFFLKGDFNKRPPQQMPSQAYTRQFFLVSFYSKNVGFFLRPNKTWNRFFLGANTEARNVDQKSPQGVFSLTHSSIAKITRHKMKNLEEHQ